MDMKYTTCVFTALLTGYLLFEKGDCITKCNSGFTGSCCDECTDGMYGTACNITCPHCRKCNRTTGNCIFCGYLSYGDRCQHTCSRKKCRYVMCQMDTGSCTAVCKDGYSGDKCCLNNMFCKTCSSDTECSQCIDGKYGEQCNMDCPRQCQNSVCNKDGTCSICTNGYYGDTCQNECPANCNANTCNMNGHCTSCRDGFYGNYCSQSCRSNCSMCDTSGLCLRCERAYFGPSCETACPGTCLACQSLTSCRSCVDGYYGAACEKKCPDQCKHGTACHKYYGHCEKCPDGKAGRQCNRDCGTDCNACDINRRYCLSCKDGQYGAFYYDIYHCHHSCPSNCLNRKCKVDTGYCYNCTEGFHGNKCDCPVSCKCEYNSGTCSSCKDGFANTNNKCECRQDMCTDSSCATSCKNTTWYLDAESRACCQCSQTCKNRECSSSTGCASECVDGFYGQNCDKTCSSRDKNCLKCEARNEYFTGCIECVSGNYPNNQNSQTKKCTRCSDTCLNRKCSTTKGFCTDGCEIGYWGEFCQNVCPLTCSKCNRDYGSCEEDPVGKCSPETLDKDSGGHSSIYAGVGGAIGMLVVVVVIQVVFKLIRKRNSSTVQERRVAKPLNEGTIQDHVEPSEYEQVDFVGESSANDGQAGRNTDHAQGALYTNVAGISRYESLCREHGTADGQYSSVMY